MAEFDSILAVGPILGKLADMTRFRLVGVEEKTVELPTKKANDEVEIQEAANMTIEISNSDNPYLIADTHSESP
jgi:hypothetical protein